MRRAANTAREWDSRQEARSDGPLLAGLLFIGRQFSDCLSEAPADRHALSRFQDERISAGLTTRDGHHAVGSNDVRSVDTKVGFRIEQSHQPGNGCTMQIFMPVGEQADILSFGGRPVQAIEIQPDKLAAPIDPKKPALRRAASRVVSSAARQAAPPVR